MNKNTYFESIEYCSDQTQQYFTLGSFVGLYPQESITLTVSEDEISNYLFGSKEIYYNYVNKILKIFNDLPSVVDIYRVIDESNYNNINFKWLGEHWTFNKESAINFANTFDNDKFVLFSGKTTKDNIDWEQTIKNYFYYSLNGDYFDENELTIKDCTKKSIKNLTYDIIEKK